MPDNDQFSQELLDILMSGWGGATSSYGGAPFLPGEMNMGGLGPDPADEPRGSSLQDLYDFLLTPKHRQRRSISPGGRFTHYGPSREGSVSREDQATAEFIMGQMREEEDRKITMDRFRKADETMTGRGPKAGGKISTRDLNLPPTTIMGIDFPGITKLAQSETIASKGPMTSEDRMSALGGGYKPDTVLEAEALGASRGGFSDSSIESARRQYNQNAEKAKDKAIKKEEDFEAERYKYAELVPYEGLSLMEIYKKIDSEEGLPQNVVRLIKYHGDKVKGHMNDYATWLDRAAAVGAAIEGGGIKPVESYLAGDGQIVK